MARRRAGACGSGVLAGTLAVTLAATLAIPTTADAACRAQQSQRCEAGAPRWQPRGKVSWTIDYSADLAASGAKAPQRDAYVVPLHVVEGFAAAATSGAANPVDDIACKRNGKLVCYTNCGAWEEGHWNEAILDPVRGEMLGKAMDGYPKERWLDIRRLDVMRKLIGDKFTAARRMGCDALLCDNTEAWITGTDGKDGAAITAYRERGIAAVKELAARNVAARTGFEISYDDQVRFNRMLAEEAHAQCLSIGLINDVFQIAELAGDFDFALNEQCHHCGWCDLYAPFAAAGKPVLHLEFRDNEGFCKAGSPPMIDICAANAAPSRVTFSSLKREASSKLHELDEPQTCQ